MTADRDFSRQSFLGPEAEQLLANVRVAIAGLGGGGSHIAQQLAHAGVGHFRVIDPDAMEASNLNRLVGGTESDIVAGTKKIDIATRLIKGIRPWAEVLSADTTWQETDSLIRDAHVIFGCVDGYQQRDYLERAARRFGVPLIDIGMDITPVADRHFAVAGQMIVSLPGQPCMHCLGFLTPENLAVEENRYGAAGINPQVVWTNGTLASLAVGAFMKMLTPWLPAREPYTWLELDGNQQTVTLSQRPHYMNIANVCPHYGGQDALGDPQFDIRRVIGI